jgi:hypothetical protein
VFDYSGKVDLLHEFIVEFGTLVYQPQFCEIASSHAVVQCTLNEEDNQEPVECNDSKIGIDREEPNDCNSNREGNLNSQIEITEEIEDDLEIYVLELKDLSLRDPFAAFRVQK